VLVLSFAVPGTWSRTTSAHRCHAVCMSASPETNRVVTAQHVPGSR
jgi:hypothetical protein